MFTLQQTLDFWWASKNFFFQLKKAFEQVVKKLLKIVQKRSQKKWSVHFQFSYKNFEFKIIRF